MVYLFKVLTLNIYIIYVTYTTYITYIHTHIIYMHTYTLIHIYHDFHRACGMKK